MGLEIASEVQIGQVITHWNPRNVTYLHQAKHYKNLVGNFPHEAILEVVKTHANSHVRVKEGPKLVVGPTSANCWATTLLIELNKGQIKLTRGNPRPQHCLSKPS